MNEVQSAEEIRLGFSIRSVCKKYFGIDVDYLGYVNRESEARNSVRSRVPLVDLAPDSQGAAYLRRVALRLIDAEKK